MRHFSVGIFFTIAVMMAAVTTPVRAEETPVDGGQIVACEETNAGSIPLRLRRSESFFGMHMDFHCGMTDQNVGANTTPEMVQAIIDRIRPDYIQIDCKGHPGVSSYPTKVGNPCPSIVGDPLRVWRDVTEANGVGLYMHYSGIWDNRACELHPEWAAMDAAGNRSSEKMSVFGPYADQLLIPQLKELAMDYGVDGMWVDGECWATVMDYGAVAKKRFCEKVGCTLDQIPNGPADPLWYEWATFHRDAFRDYMRHYLTEVNRDAPKFQIASNWAFTDHMPEPICAEVAYLSGDYSPTDSINAARYSSRFMASQGRSWDLMAWSFAQPAPDQPPQQKPAIQLQREAACVLAQGGGFQAYYTQNRDGSMDLNKISAMEDVGNFVRARQPFCQGATVIPQVALLCPTESHYRRVSEQDGSLFPWSIQWQRGILQCLLDNNYPVSIVTEQKFMDDPARYPVVVVCEWTWLRDDLAQSLRQYVHDGGRLLVISDQTARSFLNWSEVTGGVSAHLPILPTVGIQLPRVGGTQVGVRVDFRKDGDGRIAIISTSITEQYHQKRPSLDRAMVRSAMDGLFVASSTSLIVSVSPNMETGRLPVDVSVMRTADGRTAVHLVNVSGDHTNQGIIPEIAPVENVTLSIQCDECPNTITLQPENRPLAFTWNDTSKTARLTVDTVPIHEILVVE